MTSNKAFGLHAAFWLTAILLVAACGPVQQTSTFDLLMQADSDITNAADTVADAIALGTLDPTTETYGRIYKALQSADRAMDAAWSAYRAGDMIGADGARRVALDTYLAVRPLIAELAQ